MTQTSLSPRAWAELILLSALWGGSFLSIRVALDEIGPLTVVAHRVGWAALALWAVIAWRRLPLPRDPRVWGALAVMGILNNVIPFGLMAGASSTSPWASPRSSTPPRPSGACSWPPSSSPTSG